MILLRAAAAILGTVLLFTSALPAVADDTTTTTGTSSEAWYSRADGCDNETLDCSLLPPPHAYPEHTLHVGITAGDTTAETYLELDTSGVPEDATITGATLTLPVNTDPEAGSLRASDAALLICLVTEFIPSSHGSLDTPPEHNCDAASSPARFQPEPEPAFTADLTPFAAHWKTGDTPRLAVLPAPEATKAADSWHVAFWDKRHNTGDPITAELSYETSENDLTLKPKPDVTDPAIPASGPEPHLPTAAAPAEPLDGPAPATAQLSEPIETKPPAPDTAPKPQAAPTYRTVSYPYPIRWTMPLIMLIAVVVVGRALTKRLEAPV